MLQRDQLLELLSDLESDRVERTVSTNARDKFGEAVCAFANDLPGHGKPGYLLIGVTNDGTPSGLTVTDEVLTNLGGLRSEGNILPPPVLHIAKFTLDGGDVAVVEVQPSDLPPVRYNGRVWIRVGPRRAVATEQEERILSERRVAMARSFDARPCQEATLDDLALGQFDAYRRVAVDADTIAANHRPLEQQLASLRFFDPKRHCPTHAGILLFGQNPRFFLPGAYVQYLRMPGTELTDIPQDQAEISGDLLTVLKELELRVRLAVQTGMRSVSPLKEQLAPDYPEQALRELLLNAVMHRSYDSNTPIRFYVFADHVEIQSPGGLYGEATRANFPHQNSYRNPVIAEAMKALGYVNRFGYGIERAQALLRQNCNPPAAFEFDERNFLVVIKQAAP
jgi:ATP-dependent DNA helicase RecG